jgi:hypothetical protein
VPAPRHDERAHGVRTRLFLPSDVGTEQRTAIVSEYCHRQRIAEDQRPVEDLMRSAMQGGAECRPAWFACAHGL